MSGEREPSPDSSSQVPDVTQQPQSVPIRYVHRTVPSDVFLTGWQQVGDDAFSLRARWPASHPVFTAVCGRWNDPLLIAETVRQSGLLVAHAAYGVPPDHHFLMWELRFSVVGATPPPAGTVVELGVRLSGHDVKRRSTGLVSMRYEVVLEQEGRRVATGGASFSCTTPAAYRRLRGARLGAAPTGGRGTPVAPQRVGRSRPEHVVLADGPGPGRWRLLVEADHPVVRDHPVDHVPGMVLLEAARQACEAVTVPGQVLVVSLEGTFHRYVEYHTPCWVEAECDPPGPTGGPTTVRVAGHQDGQPRFDVTFGVRRCEP